jgi:hypothetical protein
MVTVAGFFAGAATAVVGRDRGGGALGSGSSAEQLAKTASAPNGIRRDRDASTREV